MGLAYTGSPDFNGADTLTVATSDGTAIHTDTIAITVNAVNDAPALLVAASASFRRERAAGAVVANAGHHRSRQH